MLTVKISYSGSIHGPDFAGVGRGKTLEAAALNAHRDAGFVSGTQARIANDAGDGRYGVRFVCRARPRSTQTFETAIWDLRIVP